MKRTTCFIFGVLTPLLLIPILGDIATILNSISEYIISVLTVKMIKNNNIIETFNNKGNGTSAIGFCAPSDSDYED